MNKFDFTDDKTSGIWWATNLEIQDSCKELKSETGCNDKEIIDLLKSISDSIEKHGL
tara:strand:+ start:713 stop:883 length:171 start_codon:yes stop_codon:yes gene_type:complete